MRLRHHFLCGIVVAGLLCGSLYGSQWAAAAGAVRMPSAASASSGDISGTAAEASAAPQRLVRITDVTNIRQSPSLEAAVLKKAQPGQTYAILKTVAKPEGDWHQVLLAEDKTAYIASWVVETAESQPEESPAIAQEQPEQQSRIILNIIDVTNVRAEPSLEGAILAKAQPGQTYTAIGTEGAWYKVALADGKPAYIAGWVVTSTTLSGSASQSADSQVYIYHTHNRESWKSVAANKSGTSVDDAKTNITLVGLELGQILQQKGIPAITANDDIAGRLVLKNLSYAQAYSESRKTIQEAIKTTPSLSYFFDIHRDADVPYSQTTATINGKTYARIMFVIGTGNPNYADNAAFAEELNQLLEKKYPGLSRGVLVKNAHQGNGEYNQSLSPHSLLLEFGGVNNTLEENKRTAAAFADIFAEYYASVQSPSKQ
ncbi:stage II sporulation protein P [Paenibacillus sp. YN15]|uniref:stage II sporulation protein P n=1 Tax=Paenibacillus sp. YN15 TaxID=1742774 RepID=UPI0015EC890F|nr:stage II sporulation protein P [Paenibacillus sp. YN15]